MVDSQSDFVKERLAFVAECIEAAKNEKPKIEDASMGRTAYSFRRGDDPIVVHHVTVPDVTPQDYKKFTENYRETIFNYMTEDGTSKPPEMKVLKEINGKEVLLYRMAGMLMVSDRSMIIQQYAIEEENGAHRFFCSSKESSAMETGEFAKEIGKDVISTLEIQYYHFRPTEDGKGSHVTHVNCSKPNGSIPNMIVDGIANAQCNSLLKMTKYLKTLLR